MVALGLTAVSLVGQYYRYCLGCRAFLGLVSKFNLDAERNYPTWFSSFLLLGCSFLLFVIAGRERAKGTRFARHWTLLAILFLGMSAEEVAGLHELMDSYIRHHPSVHLSGFLFFSWVIPASIIVTVVSLSYLRFLIHLPRRVRSLSLLAGAMYVGGALVMEMAAGKVFEVYGYDSFPYAVENAAEELLEMLGAIVFLRALLVYIETNGSGIETGPLGAKAAIDSLWGVQ